MNDLGNIEHPTFNAEHSMDCYATPTSMFSVECSMLNVSPLSTGGRL